MKRSMSICRGGGLGRDSVWRTLLAKLGANGQSLRLLVLPVLVIFGLLLGSTGAWAAAEIGVDWDDDQIIDPALDAADATPSANLGETTTGTAVACDGVIDIDFGVTPLNTAVPYYFRISNPDTAAIAPGILVGDGDALALLLPDISGVAVPAGFSIGAGHPFAGGTVAADVSSAIFPIQLNAVAAGPYAGQLSFNVADDGGLNVTRFCFDIAGVVDNAVVPAAAGEILLQDVTDVPTIVDMIDGAPPEVDFATAAAPTPQGTPVDRIFRITNTDALNPLNLGGIAFTNNECTITDALPNQNLAPLATIDFTVRFKATNAGTIDPATGLVAPVKCEMIIANSDAGEGPFNTILNGYVEAVDVVVVAPEIAVADEGADIADNTVSTFPSTFAGTPVNKTFTITNAGTADLDLKSLTIGGVNASVFSWTCRRCIT